jgi:hypothetical protein
MDIIQQLVRARLAFMMAHDGQAPRVARLSLAAATAMRERLALDRDFLPVDGRSMHGVILVEDASQVADLILE